MKIAEKVLKVLEAGGPYVDIISKFLNSKGVSFNGVIVRDIDPRWVEAYLRLKHDTLDHLSKEEIHAEIPRILRTIKNVGRDAAEKLAKSYGL